MKLIELESEIIERELMKRFIFLVLSITLAMSGAMACGESASNQEGVGQAVVSGNQNNPSNNPTPSNNPNATPEDLGGTNLAPPPAPPVH